MIIPEKVACGPWESGATKQKIGFKVLECGSQVPALFSGIAVDIWDDLIIKAVRISYGR